MDEPPELQYNGHWRMAVWTLRVGYVGLAVAIAGLIVMSLVEVVADDGVAAAVAELADLAEQPGEAAVALAGVLVQVGLERVELAGPWCLPAPVGEPCQVAARS
jgi:hypothetical protein